MTTGQGIILQCTGTAWEVIASNGFLLGTISVYDNAFIILDNSDPTKSMMFDVGAQATGSNLIFVAGPQTASRTLSVPVLTGGDTMLTENAAQTVTALKSFWDSAFKIVGSADSTKTLKFEVDAQSANADLTIDVGAQTVDRTLSIPVLGGADTIATQANANTFTGLNAFSAATKILRLYASATDGYPDSKIYVKEAIALHAHYAFLDESVVNFDGNVETPPLGHASSNMNPSIAGSQSFAHHHDYQATGQYGCAGTLTHYANFYAQPYISTGTITDLGEFWAKNPSSSGGAITTLYGFYCESLTAGGTNWAFYASGSTPSYFGGAVTCGTSLTVTTTTLLSGLLTVSRAAGGASTALFENSTNNSYAFIAIRGTGAGGGQFQFEYGTGGGTVAGGVYGDASGLNFYTGTSTINLVCDGTNVVIASGKNLKLGNAYVNTPQVPTGYVVIYDSTGTAYKVPCNV